MQEPWYVWRSHFFLVFVHFQNKCAHVSTSQNEQKHHEVQTYLPSGSGYGRGQPRVSGSRPAPPHRRHHSTGLLDLNPGGRRVLSDVPNVTPPSWSVNEPQRRRSQLAGRCEDDGETSHEPRNDDLVPHTVFPLLGRTFVFELVLTHVWVGLQRYGRRHRNSDDIGPSKFCYPTEGMVWAVIAVSLHRTPADTS